MARLVSLVVVTALIVFLGLTFFQVIAPFLLPLFVAGVVAILCRPLYLALVRRMPERPRLAAGLTTGAVLLGGLVPMGLGIVLASVQLSGVARTALDSRRWDDAVTHLRAELDIHNLAARVEPWVGHEVDPERLQAELRAGAQKALLALAERSLGIAGVAFGLLGAAVSGLVGVAMFIIALYYFLADGPALLAATEALVPVHRQYQQELVARFTTVVRAVVLATFLSALGQGMATAVMLFAFGFRQFFLLVIAATFSALIPVAGTWLVWGPCAAWLAWQGAWVQATAIAVLGLVVVGTLDNVIRTYILQSDAKLHPLLAFVSVLGGLQVMGLWGVFVGPVVASCLHALIQIFNTELAHLSRERQEALSAAAGPPAAVVPTPEPAAVPNPTATTGPTTSAGEATDTAPDAGPKRPRRSRRRRSARK